MKTFLSLAKDQGHKGQKKVRRWKVYFALNFNLMLKEHLREQAEINAGHGTSGQFMRTQIDYDGGC